MGALFRWWSSSCPCFVALELTTVTRILDHLLFKCPGLCWGASGKCGCLIPPPSACTREKGAGLALAPVAGWCLAITRRDGTGGRGRSFVGRSLSVGRFLRLGRDRAAGQGRHGSRTERPEVQLLWQDCRFRRLFLAAGPAFRQLLPGAGADPLGGAGVPDRGDPSGGVAWFLAWLPVDLSWPRSVRNPRERSRA